MTVQRLHAFPTYLRQRLTRAVFVLLFCGGEFAALGGAYLSDGSAREAPAYPPAESQFRQDPSSRSSADQIDEELRVRPSRIADGNASQGHMLKGSLESEVVAGRRLTVVRPTYKVNIQPSSNLANVPESADNIEVHAGVVYEEFVISAASGLGIDHLQIMVKLVPFDMAATLQTCAEIDAYMGKPFNGATGQATQGATSENYNQFKPADGFVFPQAGKFRLCYFAGSTWEELSPAINVIGSEDLTDKIWCSIDLMMETERCALVPIPPGCECKGIVEGYNWDSTNSKLTTLGEPNPAVPTWRTRLADTDKNCGETDSNVADANPPFLNKISSVVNMEGYEIHNFGVRTQTLAPQTFKVCYCVGYDYNNENEACYSEAPADFPQTIGTLITVKFRITFGSITDNLEVFPVLRFTLQMECGSQWGATGGATNVGGCSSSNEVRYRIVEKKTENNFAYFEAGNGCRFLPEIKTTISGSTTVGGQVGPTNCLGPVTCNDEPESLGPKYPAWDSIQMDASYENDVMIPKDYDICYCDGNCLNSLSWFKAGKIRVETIQLDFLDEFKSAIGTPVVNVMYYLRIQGTDGVNAKIGSWSSSGTQTREMKILSDPYAIVDKISCLSEAQPDTVSGHRLVSPNTDYEEPAETMGGAAAPIGQRYGEDRVEDSNGNVVSESPRIKLLQSGWYAVCYCDSNCNEMLNWAMYGRVLIAGPNLNQQYTRYIGAVFDLNVTGWGLDTQNRIRILGFDNALSDCGVLGSVQSDYVLAATSAPVMLQQSTESNQLIKIEYDTRGSLITFAKSHGLLDGDQFWLASVNVQATFTQDDTYSRRIGNMYNRNHEVFVHCDDVATQCYKILIPVQLEPHIFGDVGIESATWRRSSTQLFRNMRVDTESPEGRGYKICWAVQSPNDQDYDFSGQVGSITVKDPTKMPEAALGLTSVMPSMCGYLANGQGAQCDSVQEQSPGAPVMISFTTGDIARYAQATGPMQLIITFQWAEYNNEAKWREAAQPRDYLLNELQYESDYDPDQGGNPTQAECGKIFLEMWSEDPNGFPMPQGCYFDEECKVSDGNGGFELKRNSDCSSNAEWINRNLHIVFSPRNHLRKETKYALVLNARIDGAIQHLESGNNWPPDGAVYIWSMDDMELNRFGVVEQGKAHARVRSPPRDSLQNLELGKSPDGLFNATDGFRVLPAHGQHPIYGCNSNNCIDNPKNSLIQLESFCLAHNEVDPDRTPTVENECKLCVDEYDCGNGNKALGIPPVADLNWCTSPIDIPCAFAKTGENSATAYPMFDVALRADYYRPIKQGSLLRIFFQPLLAWDMTGTGGASCNVAMRHCTGPGGGACRDPICATEMVTGGQVIGPPAYPVNVMKITLPAVMADITSSMSHTIKIGGAPLPHGGFFPTRLIAEIAKEDETAPSFWSIQTPAGAKLYKTPKVMSASIVTYLGDGNVHPFKLDTDNILYIRLVVGANIFARQGDKVSIMIYLPKILQNNAGYKCAFPNNDGLVVPTLGVVGDSVPSYQGRLGGYRETEAEWRNKDADYACEMSFKQDMIYYAYSSVFVAVQVNNPIIPLKADDPENLWKTVIRDNQYGSGTQPICSDAPVDVPLGCGGLGAGGFNFTPPTGLTGYAANVPTLGKLSDLVISPGNFGLTNKNMMHIFFKTEQQVGTNTDVEAEIWVDAPTGFEFGRYCGAFQLSDSYYIPEPAEVTYRLPVGELIVCYGATTDSSQLTYNRAKVTTTGRLLAGRKYGFSLEVTNTPSYVRSQLDGWTIWTYRKSSQDGVDGAYDTARMNSQLPVLPDQSWGSYGVAMPAGAFVVSVADLRPTVTGMEPSDITFLPITVALPMQKAIRIFAPAGYQWDFIQTEFRYRAPNRGVPDSQIVPGAEQDLPISGVPASPVSEPRNMLTMDYMQAEWIPGVKYGFIAKIRIPMLPPTASANYFTIEFGYDEPKQVGRLEAGVFYAPLVQRIINGGISFTTSIKDMEAEISFTMRLITHIPRGGGLFITGPPNFFFAEKCQPKPFRPEYPELPYDSTCSFQSNPATGAAEISIIAGPSGIPALFYRFYLEGKNPPQNVLQANAGSWSYYSYSVISERTALDYHTTVPGYAVNSKMTGAILIAPQKVFGCQVVDRTIQNKYGFVCPNGVEWNFRDYQFYPPKGFRNDRPGEKSALIFEMRLDKAGAKNGEILTVRAPEGYVFSTECKVETDHLKIFDATNPDTNTDTCSLVTTDDGSVSETCALSFYSMWPSTIEASNCHGIDNVAKITMTCGVALNCPWNRNNRYLFRLEVLKNPPATPVPNMFMLEFDNQASDPFEGVPIWSFTDTVILPTTTAASLRTRATMNNVTVHLRPTNDLPIAGNGHMLIEAPAGFILDTHCFASIMIHPDEALNLTNYTAGSARNEVLKYAEFNSGEFECEGDVTMSSRARLHFKDNKYLKSGILYRFVFEVTNPQVTTQYEDPWLFTSYGTTANDILDKATVPGFPINKVVESFAWMTPNSVNALAKQILEFNMSFPIDVIIGDMVEIIAPVTYFFSERGDAQCPEYQYLDGNLRKTKPLCGANTISWSLEEEEVPAGTGVRFLVKVQNPPRTPTLNLFQVRQVAPSGQRKSSRMIPGYDIIPELTQVVVNNVAPQISCQALVPIITQMSCTATGSRGKIEISFMPNAAADLVQVRAHIDGNSFDFTSATLPDPATPGTYLTIQHPPTGVSATSITGVLEVRIGTTGTIIVEGAAHPSTPGIAKISVTTFKGGTMPENRVDEKLDLEAYRILDYINRRYSNVNPFYYRAVAATVTFELEPYMGILEHDVLRITRPPGYTVKDASLQVSRDLRVSEHGLDFMRRWSSQFENPEDYYMVVSRYVAPMTRILFSISADLPSIPEANPFWFFRTYRVEPFRDTDGEILDANPVPYPWIGRDITAIGTNDGAFTGFLLVGQVPFTVQPTLRTPGAGITLKVVFDLAAPVEAGDGERVRVEVNGPTGYQFADNCFAETPSEFDKCTGYRSIATLRSVWERLPGLSDSTLQQTLHLAVTNPGQTPSKNTWTLSIYRGASKQEEYWSLVSGYPIENMPVTYRGNNQLAVTDTAFFTFAPLGDSTSSVLYIEVIPPPDQNYRLLCTGVESLDFGEPECSAGAANTPLTLRFSNGTLQAGKAYTFGVGVLNPGGKPASDVNYWGVLLKDYQPLTFDGHLRVQGADLKSVPLRAGLMGWKTAEPNVMNTVAIQLRVLHPITAGTITRIVIGAPQYVRFIEDPKAVITQPALPLFVGNPTEISNPPEISGTVGPLLMLNLDVNSDIVEGMYTIRFDCSNPQTTPWDNTWSVLVMKNIELEFSHYKVGFQPGQDSPLDVGVTTATNSARHSWVGYSTFTNLLGLVLFSLMMTIHRIPL